MTFDVVDQSKRAGKSGRELSPEQAAAAAMIADAKARGLALTGPGGLLKVFTKSVLEMALNEEMHTAHDVAVRLHACTGNAAHVVGTVLADAGYNNDANMIAPGPDRVIAVGKARDEARAATEQPTQGPPRPQATPREANAHRLRTSEGREIYKRRGATGEPPIGNLKKIIDRFSNRGLHNAINEIHLAATAFSILKVHRTVTAQTG